MFTGDETEPISRPSALADESSERAICTAKAKSGVEGFRAPGDAASTAELLKFLIDRTGYIKQLEEEDTPEVAVDASRTCANWSTPPWIRATAARR